MSEDILQYRQKRFFEILRKYSFDKEDPISEWRFVEIVDNDGTNRCICTAPIQYLYKIENKETKATLIVGSECIQRWLQGLLRCKECACVLGNVVKRLRKEDYHCRSCKKILQKKQEQQEQEELRKRKMSKLGHCRLYWYGPYYQKMFHEVIDNIPYVEKLINIENKNQTLELFTRYVKTVYDLEEREVG